MHSKRMKKIRRSRKRKGKIRFEMASISDTVGDRLIVGIK